MIPSLPLCNLTVEKPGCSLSVHRLQFSSPLPSAPRFSFLRHFLLVSGVTGVREGFLRAGLGITISARLGHRQHHHQHPYHHYENLYLHQHQHHDDKAWELQLTPARGTIGHQTC